MFNNELNLLRAQVLDHILISGALNGIEEHIEILNPLKYKNKNIVFLDCRQGEISVHNQETNQLENVSLQDMELESLSKLADHLVNPRNWKISKAEIR